ncbi:hypothetical protein MLD38_013545 [Melastoma candidum]|uniref:Uncharacterized protein n=1 Tax=Melastoma candidum TaxID=119954 RepID=A0ACB9RE48_9MYRT|nr:hypothetical protein MLD38_013545 [Melastoma candidum]
MESLISDQNRSIATLAITTLLKTGNESSVDRLMKQITNFMSDIADEFKIVVVEAIRSLCLKFPLKYRSLMNFLSNILREEGGFNYKKAIVYSIAILIRDIPDAKESGLLHLCEFIEDCEFTYLSIQIIHFLGIEGPKTSDPNKYIRYIYNRIHLENATVLASAISTLVKFAMPRIFVLLRRCLFDNDDEAIDFGLSVFFKPGQKFNDVVGSPYYVAPEVLRKNYGQEADVWTAGVILYILLSGVPPFWAETQQGLFDAVLKGYIDFDSDPWPVISNSAKDLIRRMLCSRPSDRLTAHEVLCHPWICENGVASDRPLDAAVMSRLKQFSAMNKLKKMALRVIAESLSEEEIAGLREMFTAMDTDSSGAITFDELKAGLRKYGSTMKDTEIRDPMEAADIDNSGTIDYGEFIAATMHLNKLEREEHLVAAFRYFDKDGSGYITVDELQQACVEHHMPDAFLEDIIKEVDQDNDGRIDYGEFVAMMQKGNAGIGRRTMRNSLNISMRDAPGALSFNHYS